MTDLPPISKESAQKAAQKLSDKSTAFEELRTLDKKYADKIDQNDVYRIQKAFEIFYQTQLTPSVAFETFSCNALCQDIEIFEILCDRSELRKKIRQRTETMVQNGLIAEATYLLDKYSKDIKPMKSIGLAESVDYLEGKTSLDEAIELISIHTGQLAKRQETFNKSKFKNSTKLPLDELRYKIESEFISNL